MRAPRLSLVAEQTSSSDSNSKGKTNSKTMTGKTNAKRMTTSSRSSSSNNAKDASEISITKRVANFARAARKTPPATGLDVSADRSLGRQLLTAHFTAAREGPALAAMGERLAPPKAARSRGGGAPPPPPRPSPDAKPRLRAAYRSAAAARSPVLLPESTGVDAELVATPSCRLALSERRALGQGSVTIAVMTRRRAARKTARDAAAAGRDTFPPRSLPPPGDAFEPFRDISVSAEACVLVVLMYGMGAHARVGGGGGLP